MTVDSVKRRIGSLISHFTFDYAGMNCGVDPISSTHFDMWCEDDFITVDSIDRVMDTPFFNGKPLKSIVQNIIVIDQ
ncbi:MAG: hypothetical protein GX303_06210 [Clostridiales bacterium]|nr:hypothetical protein [Clostridiales bacterium]